ncbi:MAG: dihydroorotase [Bacteroidia bacterium]
MAQKTILIRNGTICHPNCDSNRKQLNILIKEGKLFLNTNVDTADLVLDATNCLITPGLFDLRCHLQDPGNEHREDIKSGTDAAAAGGFTAIAIQPDTEPILQNKSQIQYILRSSQDFLTQVLPIAAATQDFKSTEITEMFDLKNAGAVAFSNGNHSYKQSDGLLRALQYAKNLDVLLMSHAIDAGLAGLGEVNESAGTTNTGLRQQPILAEVVQIKKEIAIAKYADSPLHFSHISAAESVELVRQAKKDGLKISCDVSIWHLIYTDVTSEAYDSNYKVIPPFRTQDDIEACIAGINDGTIDAICSDHLPQNIENKLVEFDYASFGIIGLQTMYSVYQMHLSSKISMDAFIKAASINPRRLLKQESVDFAEGAEANLAILHPTQAWNFDSKSNLSKSFNSPVFKQQLRGKCMATIRGNYCETY